MSDFHNLLNRSARILSEENNRDNIDVDGALAAGRVNDELDRDKSKFSRTQGTGWDAGEWRTTVVEAVKLSETEEGRQELARRGIERANIANGKDGRLAVFSAGQPAWHGLGRQISNAVSGKEALEHAALVGWNMEKIPHQVEVVIDDKAKMVETGTFAVVRTDTGEVVGRSVGGVYKIFENEQLAELVDAVMDYGAQVITGGALGKGEKVWLLAKMPETAEVAEGDTLEQYVLFSNSHDGTGSIRVYPTSVRVECQNTYRTSIAAGKGKGISIRHTKNAGKKIAETKRAIGLAVAEQDAFVKMARELAKAELTVSPEAYFNEVLDDIVSSNIAGERVTYAKLKDGTISRAIAAVVDNDKREAEQKKLDRYNKRRGLLYADIVKRFNNERNNGKVSIAGSAWAAVNAVTEHLNHSALWSANNPNSTREKISQKESRFESLIDGKVANQSDFAILTAQRYVNN